MSNCAPAVINGLQCVVCPEVVAVAAVADVTLRDSLYGWNAGAYSTTRLSGDCYVQFSLPSVVGAVVGLANRETGTDPRDVPYGFYVHRLNGKQVWTVVELGFIVPGLGLVERYAFGDDGEYFRIERRGSKIYYKVDGKTVYESTTPSTDSLVVASCLYASFDGVD